MNDTPQIAAQFAVAEPDDFWNRYNAFAENRLNIVPRAAGSVAGSLQALTRTRLLFGGFFHSAKVFPSIPK